MKVLVLMSPPLFARLEELDLALLDDVPGDGSELGVLPDLVGRARADRGPVNIHVRLLAHVEPDDRPVLDLSSLSLLVQQIDPSVPKPVVQSRRRPLLGPSPG